MSNYYITIAFYSEPNYQGNCSLYYYGGKNGNKIILTGRANKKLYVSEKAAQKVQLLLATFYPTAKVEMNNF